VKATTDETGAVDFEVDGVKAKHARLKLDKDSGEHPIEFELHDHSGRNLKFDSSDPIWVGEDCPCPPAQGINSDQITVSDCSDQKLNTLNSNSGRARELRYQLNFVAGDGAALNCDPVMENGGGIKPLG
jgi:hypothetical protein